MLFMLWLTVRLLTRLLVLPNADDSTRDLEILVLRHQLRVLRRKTGRPRFTAGDRALLAAASRVLPRQRWASSFLVMPQTLLRWHRTLVRRKWTYGKEPTPGRPPIDPQTAALILRRVPGRSQVSESRSQVKPCHLQADGLGGVSEGQGQQGRGGC